MIDRLSVDRNVKEVILPKIDSMNFLGMGINSADHVERIDQFMFAAAIGIRLNLRTPLKAKIGLIQSSAIRAEQMSAIFSLMVEEMRKANCEDKISDQEEAFNIIQEYANTGFDVMYRWINESNGEGIEWTLLEQMDTMYDECFREN